MAVQDRLSAKFTATSDRKKAEQGALVEFYAVADQKPAMGRCAMALTERGKAGYGRDRSSRRLWPPRLRLRPAEPRRASAPPSRKRIDWLADAEIKVSYAVLDYATDARGGRIKPQRLSANLDPSLALPNPSEVIEFDRHPLGPRRLSTELPARPAAIRGAQAEAHRPARRQSRAGRRRKPADIIPDGPVLKIGVVR